MTTAPSLILSHPRPAVRASTLIALTLGLATLSARTEAATIGSARSGFPDGGLLSTAVNHGRVGGRLVEEFSVTEAGEWLLVSDEDTFASVGFPAQAVNWVELLQHFGRPIEAVAVAPGGGWIVVAEDFITHGEALGTVPYFDDLLDQVEAHHAAGRRIDDIAFDPDGVGWVLTAGGDAFCNRVPGDLYRAVVDARVAQRPLQQVQFGGDGAWAVMAGDWFASDGAPSGLRGNVRRWQTLDHRIDHLGLAPDGRSYVRISNGPVSDDGTTLGAVERDLAGGDPLWEQFDSYQVQGLGVALLSGGQVVEQRGYGELEVGTERFVSTETRFPVASVSKLIASLTTLALISQSPALDLDSSVWELGQLEGTADTALEFWLFLGESDDGPLGGGFFPKDMTVRHLLSHTSGLPGMADNTTPGWGSSFVYDDDIAEPSTLVSLLSPDCDEDRCLVESEDMVWPMRGAGDMYSYSAGGMLVLEAVIEHVTGLPYHEAVDTLLFEPLGLDRLGYLGRLTAADWAGDVMDQHDGDGTLRRPRRINYQDTTTGMVGSVGQLASLFDLIVAEGVTPGGERLIEADLLRELATPMVVNGGGTAPYGLGAQILDTAPASCFRGDGSAIYVGHRGTESSTRGKVILNRDTGEGYVIAAHGGATDVNGTRDGEQQLVRELELALIAELGWDAACIARL